MATYRKLKSGKWQARVSRDGKEFSIGTYRTKKEAGKVEERIYYGQALNDRNMLFEDVVKEWLHDHKKPSVKESTFEQIEVIVSPHYTLFRKQENYENNSFRYKEMDKRVYGYAQ
ncbi:hypothetical protein [Sutcliffiella rhizosphaerae]|uniref:AP2-like integrase N-terminal domain-containing protein n=1 Tax=Sutcliffiella rhizosphaerae TaxID=2880967 RepID=A0ABM8YLS7_9BACI|nr:hypothetical protein [Sutcliffiella rhizosphaerae]CAG9620837.1 hypothetical protein BACCIP111883_01608 [Sutcliffiella rhizosphaerae]